MPIKQYSWTGKYHTECVVIDTNGLKAHSQGLNSNVNLDSMSKAGRQKAVLEAERFLNIMNGSLDDEEYGDGKRNDAAEELKKYFLKNKPPKYIRIKKEYVRVRVDGEPDYVHNTQQDDYISNSTKPVEEPEEFEDPMLMRDRSSHLVRDVIDVTVENLGNNQDPIIKIIGDVNYQVQSQEEVGLKMDKSLNLNGKGEEDSDVPAPVILANNTLMTQEEVQLKMDKSLILQGRFSQSEYESSKSFSRSGSLKNNAQINRELAKIRSQNHIGYQGRDFDENEEDQVNSRY